jgi:hypothetical protein
MASTVADHMPKKLAEPPRYGANAQHVLQVAAGTTHGALKTVMDEVKGTYEKDLVAALRLAAEVRTKASHINVAVPNPDKEPLLVFKQTSHLGEELQLSPDFFKAGRFFARSYGAFVDSTAWRQLRDDLAGTALATNFLLAACASVQTPAHNFALLTPRSGHPLRGKNLLKRLRFILETAKPMLLDAARAGRVARGSTQGANVLNCIVSTSALFGVAESIASLQKLYADTPDTGIRFELRPRPALLVDAQLFNRQSSSGSLNLYTRGFLGKSLRYGLVEANGRVAIHLEQGRSRHVTLMYQPKPTAAMSGRLSHGAARRQQVARLPGDLQLRREPDKEDGLPGRAFYATFARPELEVPTALAVDPGSRTFATCLDLDTCAVYQSNGEWTANRTKTFLQLSDELLALGKQTSALPFRRHVQKLAQQLRTKQQNWTGDMHQRLAQFFVDKARIVLLPKLSVGRMVQRNDPVSGARRNLHPMAARLLLACRHGEFRSQVLASKLRYFPDCTIYDFSESFTTKSLFAESVVSEFFDTCVAHTKQNKPPNHRLQQVFHVH